jgi:hypothetical protein
MFSPASITQLSETNTDSIKLEITIACLSLKTIKPPLFAKAGEEAAATAWKKFKRPSGEMYLAAWRRSQ